MFIDKCSKFAGSSSFKGKRNKSIREKTPKADELQKIVLIYVRFDLNLDSENQKKKPTKKTLAQNYEEVIVDDDKVSN